MKKFDCCVVGGGIGGPATALLLAHKGARVALIDEGRIGRNRLSTHFIWPRGMSYLFQLGLRKSLRQAAPFFADMQFRIEDVTLKGIIPKEVTANRLSAVHGNINATPLYACIRRQYLDKMLVEACQDAGVEVFLKTKINGIEFEHGRVAALTTEASQKFSSNYFVAADGRESTLAKLLETPLIDHRPISTSCVWSYFSNVAPTSLRLSRCGREGFAAVSTSDGLTMVLVWGPREDAARFLRMKDKDLTFLKKMHTTV